MACAEFVVMVMARFLNILVVARLCVAPLLRQAARN